ncbi:MAG TPA: hypothetical protein VNN19_04130 [bacterium]|nr:hypothetical protein [bacterium]
MRMRGWTGTILAVVLAIAAAAPLITTGTADAQATSTEVLAGYLDRMELAWRRAEKDPNLLTVTKTAGLQRAERVELYIYNDPKNAVVDLLVYPRVGGQYLRMAAVSDRAGLMRRMLEENENAFGAYFIDTEGDIGFKFVFSTEAGIGYDAFKAVVGELLRIADDPVVRLVTSFR